MKWFVGLIVAGLFVLALPHLTGSGAAPTPSAGVTETADTVVPKPSPTTMLGSAPSTSIRTSPSTSTAPSTTTSPSTTASPSTTRPVDQDEVRFPLVQYLPFETSMWKVDYRIEGAIVILRVTLTPIINNATEATARTTALRAAKADFLAWLASKGAVVGTYGLIWTPTEAMNL